MTTYLHTGGARTGKGQRQRKDDLHGKTHGSIVVCCVIVCMVMVRYYWILVVPALVCRKYIVRLERCTIRGGHFYDATGHLEPPGGPHGREA